MADEWVPAAAVAAQQLARYVPWVSRGHGEVQGDGHPGWVMDSPGARLRTRHTRHPRRWGLGHTERLREGYRLPLRGREPLGDVLKKTCVVL